jgi:prepilin-type processing-associated H-X9-DG protein
VLDKVTSPCIDGGDPYDDPADEPMPNGGLINMGAYGGTPYSSMSEWELKGDINHDGKVNMIDFSIFAEYWLVSSLRAREIDNQLACSHNLMAIGRAMMFYANDYEDEFPKADRWCDLLLQYKYDHMTKEMFVCPSAEGGPSHYAINPNARGPSDPYMVLLFETTAGWNQFGGPELLAPENHQGRGCNILFVDGHVEFVESERLDEMEVEMRKTIRKRWLTL